MLSTTIATFIKKLRPILPGSSKLSPLKRRIDPSNHPPRRTGPEFVTRAKPNAAATCRCPQSSATATKAEEFYREVQPI